MGTFTDAPPFTNIALGVERVDVGPSAIEKSVAATRVATQSLSRLEKISCTWKPETVATLPAQTSPTSPLPFFATICGSYQASGAPILDPMPTSASVIDSHSSCEVVAVSRINSVSPVGPVPQPTSQPEPAPWLGMTE